MQNITDEEKEFIAFFRACNKAEKEAIMNDLRELSKDKPVILCKYTRLIKMIFCYCKNDKNEI